MKPKIIGTIVLMLFISTTTFSVIGNTNTENDEKILNCFETQITPITGIYPKEKNLLVTPTPIFTQSFIVDEDWNYWNNYPNMYTITDGNVGIGLSNPSSKLEVSGESFWITNYGDNGQVYCSRFDWAFGEKQDFYSQNVWW